MRGNGGLIGPQNIGLGGVWGVDDQRLAGPVLPTTVATANANTFVCQFLGGAGANETGAGLGLTGADLVFTQYGNPGASSGGWRACSTTAGFNCTQGLLDAGLLGLEWTLALQVRNAIGYVYDLTGVPDARLYSYEGNSASSNIYSPKISLLGQVLSAPNVAHWRVSWLKDGIIHLGVKESETLPRGWEDFTAHQRVARRVNSSFAGAAYTGIRYALGYLNSGGLDVKTWLLSKTGLSAAPL